MSAKDLVHQHVITALQKDGWTITHDPFKVRWKTRKLQIDLGAEKLIAAQKDARKIAVEIKSFIGANDLEDLYQALGQFILYRKALRKFDPQRILFLAIDVTVFNQIFDDPEGESLRAEEEIRLLVFDKQTEEIVLWKQ
ncbi:MAG TPA: element excision factor XisH family protein [Blastocatellia bacterium]|nr:element excision factor XisH family protein [Blastocatellia bacterium]